MQRADETLLAQVPQHTVKIESKMGNVPTLEHSRVQVFGGHSGWSCKALAPQSLKKCSFVSCSNPSAAIGGHAGLHVEVLVILVHFCLDALLSRNRAFL